MAAQQGWYCLQAKTIEEIHAEAHAELGMVPATVIPALESLAALPRQMAAEVELFPSFKGGKLVMGFTPAMLASGFPAQQSQTDPPDALSM